MAQGFVGQSVPEIGRGMITLDYSLIARIVSGGWYGTSEYPNSIGAAYVYNYSHSLNNEISYDIWMAKGTYTMSLIGMRNTDSGNASIYVDGALVGVHEFYGAVVYNHISTISDIIITKPGIKQVNFKIGKHASSSDYYFRFTYFWFYRTA